MKLTVGNNMARNKYVILLALALAPVSVMAEVFSCTGSDGERYFSDTPCEKVSVMEQNLENDIRRARTARIEELEVSITKTKRELIDAEASYMSTLTGRTPEERAILQENYEEKAAMLETQLDELESRRADLVEQAFADHAEKR